MVYKSKLLRYLLTLFYFPSYLLGRYEQKQTVAIILKDNFVDNPVSPSSRVWLEFYLFKITNTANLFQYIPASKFIISIHEKIQFYSVKLIVEANFTGLKYFLYHWYYTTSFVLCLGIVAVIFLLFLTTFFDLKSFLFGVKEGKEGKECKEDKETKSLENQSKLRKKTHFFRARLAYI